MTAYRIVAPHFVAGLVLAGDLVVQAAPVLSWALLKDFAFVRDYCAKRGWVVDPCEDDVQPNWLELDGVVYELRWHGNNLSRIARHADGEVTELGYDELPEQLKELL